MRDFLQYHLNDGHLYCRFREIGMCKATARRLSLALARLVRPLLYGAGGTGEVRHG
jgi:hypothetical protein